MGNRAVAIVENQTGQSFTGSASDYARFGTAMAGDMVGTNQVAEAAVGYDIATQKQLTTEERVQRGAAGVAAISGTVAGGVGLAAKGETALARVAGDAATAEGVGADATSEVACMEGCFPAGTLVATTEGHQAIEKIEEGDRVWAYDLVNSVWRPCRVLQTFRQSYEGHSVFVTVAAQAEETIEATLFHPFWVVRGESLEASPRRKHLPAVPEGATTPGRWVDAGDLRVGDQLLLRGGQIVPVRGVRIAAYHDDVYNIRVDELESYAVGWNGTLVHNNCGSEFATTTGDRRVRLQPGVPGQHVRRIGPGAGCG